jgi:hypothetical protein
MRSRSLARGAGLIRALVLLGLLSASEVLAGDFKLNPTLGLSEEYNDNIFDAVSDRRSEFVTRVRPGLVLDYRSSASGGALSYNLDWTNYAKGSHADQTSHRVNLKGGAELLPGFAFLEVSDTLSRVSLSVLRDTTVENPFLNQSEQNQGTASGYLVWHPGAKNQLKTGYRMLDTRYWGNAGVDKQQHRWFAEFDQQVGERLSVSASYSFSAFDTSVLRYDQHDVSAGLRYHYTEAGVLYGAIGNSWQVFGAGRRSSNLIWNAGLVHDLTLLTATLDAHVTYNEDPLNISTRENGYSVKLDRSFTKGALGVWASYTEYALALGGFGTLQGTEKLAFGGSARYSLGSQLTGSLALTADRITGGSIFGAAAGSDYPYHLNGSLGLSWLFNYGITAALNYTRVEYRHQWESASGARQTNRVILELNKVFGS